MKKHHRLLVIYFKELRNHPMVSNMFICPKILGEWLYFPVSMREKKIVGKILKYMILRSFIDKTSIILKLKQLIAFIFI